MIFLPVGIWQTDTLSVISGIITVFNIFLKAKKFLPSIEPAILDSTLRLLIALLLTFNIWSFQLSFDYRVMPRFIAEVVP